MLGALATITRLKIAISRPCARSARFARASLRKMKVQIEAQERSGGKTRSRVRLGCSVTRQHRYRAIPRAASAAISCFLLQRIREIRFRLVRCLSSGRTYVRTNERVFQRTFYTRSLEGVSINRANSSRITRHNNYFSRNREHDGESATRIYFYDKHPTGCYYVKWMCTRVHAYVCNRCPVIPRDRALCAQCVRSRCRFRGNFVGVSLARENRLTSWRRGLLFSNIPF